MKSEVIDHNDPLARFAYPIMAAVAGAITALSFSEYKRMTVVEVGMALFVGASFAIFVTPWLLHITFGTNEADVRTIAGITYIMAAGSNVLLPLTISRAKRWFGLGEKP